MRKRSLKMTASYEPNRLSQIYLNTAYEKLTPTKKHLFDPVKEDIKINGTKIDQLSIRNLK